MRVDEIDVNPRRIFEFVIHVAGKAVASAVVPVFPNIFGVERRKKWRSSGWIRLIIHTCAAVAAHCGRHRFHVINASAVPVITRSKKYAELLVRPEALAYGAVEFIEGASADNRRVATHAVQIKSWAL